MHLGKATAIFNHIETENSTDQEKLEAIKRVLDMETHNGITKQACFEVLSWLMEKHSTF